MVFTIPEHYLVVRSKTYMVRFLHGCKIDLYSKTTKNRLILFLFFTIYFTFYTISLFFDMLAASARNRPLMRFVCTRGNVFGQNGLFSCRVCAKCAFYGLPVADAAGKATAEGQRTTVGEPPFALFGFLCYLYNPG